MRSGPGDGKTDGMMAFLFCQGGEFFRRFEYPVFPVTLLILLVGHDTSGIGPSLDAVLAAEQTAADGRIGDDAEFLGLRHGEHLNFRLPLHQRVHRLNDVDARPALPLGNSKGFRDLPGCPVACAQIENLAVGHQFFQRPQRFLKRNLRVPPMHEKNIEPVRAETLQAGLDSPQDVPAIAAARIYVIGHRVETLRCDDQFIAFAAHQLAKDGFGLAPGIGIRAIEEVYACIAAGFVHVRRLLLIGVASEGHGSEAQLRHLKACAAKPLQLHLLPPRELKSGAKLFECFLIDRIPARQCGPV